MIPGRSVIGAYSRDGRLSATPRFLKKLGISAGMTIAIFNAPNYFNLDLGDLPDDVTVTRDAEDATADLYLIFADDAAEAERGFNRAMTLLPADGSIWIAWPKRRLGRGVRHHRGHPPRAVPPDGHGGQQGVRHRRDVVRAPVRGAQGESGRMAQSSEVEPVGQQLVEGVLADLGAGAAHHDDPLHVELRHDLAAPSARVGAVGVVGVDAGDGHRVDRSAPRPTPRC